MATDPYAALGLTKSATAAEIKSAYRKLVRTSHPDLHPDDAGAEARLKAVSAAYDLLKDPDTRARFDAGEIDASGAERPHRTFYRDHAEAPGQGFGQGSAFGDFDDPADIFAHILRLRGRGVGRPDGHPGDALIEVRIVAPPVADTTLSDFLREWRKTHAHDPRKTMMEETPD